MFVRHGCRGCAIIVPRFVQNVCKNCDMICCGKYVLNVWRVVCARSVPMFVAIDSHSCIKKCDSVPNSYFRNFFSHRFFTVSEFFFHHQFQHTLNTFFPFWFSWFRIFFSTATVQKGLYETPPKTQHTFSLIENFNQISSQHHLHLR